MRKIQYGMGGFFAGGFAGLLTGIVEMRITDNAKHPAMLFIIVSLTIIFFAITGMLIAINLLKKRKK